MGKKSIKTSHPHLDLSVIIPACNEAANLPILLDSLSAQLDSSSLDYEIIIIDDASSDATQKIVAPYLRSSHYFCILNPSKLGKSLSVLAGYAQAKGRYLAIIDADLIGCSKSIPDLYQLATSGYAMTRPPHHWTQKFFNLAPTRGPKIFPRIVFEHINAANLNNYNIESELTHTANNLSLNPHFLTCRIPHASRPKPLTTRVRRYFSTISTSLRHLTTNPVYVHSPISKDQMVGAGLTYRLQSFVTHSTLPHHLSALKTFAPWQVVLISALVASTGWGLVVSTIPTLIVITSVLSFIYLLDVIFNMYVTLKSLHFPPELTFSQQELDGLKPKNLPIYSILVPLYKEAGVLPHFITSMQKLDYPTNKLDILLLLEEGDDDTIQAGQNLDLPSHYRIIIVPKSSPKTKPKACNYGLSFVKGDYTVIYDAEDRPDPLQLKKAYLALHSDSSIGCVQAKLNYFNPHDNLLTRFFTAEYSLWFDVILPGLQSINTSIPLGGTSNHFRTSVLRQLHGWDAFNVTEDADLGTRLFNAGYITAIIDSTTLEEANSNWRNWVRQRSRWLKGYMQTYLVHMRDPIKLFKAQGVHALLFNLIVGGKISFILINPFLWVMTISYFALYAQFGAFIESIYPASIFYIAVTSLLFGNFIALYNYMIGCSKRGHWELIKYVYLIPLYWLAISYAAAVALFQLIVKPHYWEKTIHGLDHSNSKNSVSEKSSFSATARGHKYQKYADIINTAWSAGGVLVVAAFINNILNFLYNAYLGRQLSLENFGEISLFGSFMYLASVPLNALSRTITHSTAFLLGKYGFPIKEFWLRLRQKTIIFSLVVAAIWIISIPIMQRFFRVDEALPFILFAPVWVIASINSLNGGFLSGNLIFWVTAITAILESLSKFIFTAGIVALDLKNLVYAAVPLSLLLVMVVEWHSIKVLPNEKKKIKIKESDLSLSSKFYFTSVLTSLTKATYLSLDLILAKHFLSPSEAGAYSYLSLAGKMVFFLSSMFSQFLIPYASKDLGAGVNPKSTYKKLLLLVSLVNICAFLVFGLFGYISAPILWGEKSLLIVRYLPMYAFAIAIYSTTSVVISYEQVRGRYLYPLVGFILALLMGMGMYFKHNSIGEIVTIITISSIISLISILLLSKYYRIASDLYHAFIDFIGLFKNIPRTPPQPNGKLRILIFNWRDLRHKWAGGAEVYIHELSKRWVEDGHRVTIFSGNDGHSPRFEKVDGVSVVRRGGFYLVYVWAFLYYFFRLRGRYDVIIDSENGLPFFTPLYVSEPVFLLIHHVHQEVFRKSLIPPFSWFAQFLEKRVMPLVYRSTELITVSPSSKAEIISHKLTKKDPHIIYNGVDLGICKSSSKSTIPTVLYLGRLTPAKSVNVLISATNQIIDKVPNLKVIIAGDGPARKSLEKLAKALNLESIIEFKGKVTEEEKIALYQKAWVFVNPSLIEGWGITTIEANACGTPVVASDVAGLRDAVADTKSGILVPYGNASGFAYAITSMLTDEKLRKRLSVGAIDWAGNFSWRDSSNGFIQILKSNNIPIPTNYKVFVSLLLSTEKKETATIDNEVAGYQFIKSTNNNMSQPSYSSGVYTKPGLNNKKYFIKSCSCETQSFTYLSLVNQFYSSKYLYSLLQIYNEGSAKFKLFTPKPIELIKSGTKLSAVYEYINAKSLDKFNIKIQKTIINLTLNTLESITDIRNKVINNIRMRQIDKSKMILSIPLLMVKAIMLDPKSYIRTIRLSLISLLNLVQIKNSPLTISHRDIKPGNILLSKSKVYLLDTEQMVYTVGGYDRAQTSLINTNAKLVKHTSNSRLLVNYVLLIKLSRLKKNINIYRNKAKKILSNII